MRKDRKFQETVGSLSLMQSSDGLFKYIERKRQYLRWKRTHQLDRKLVKVGTEIDALDKAGVWCAA